METAAATFDGWQQPFFCLMKIDGVTHEKLRATCKGNEEIEKNGLMTGRKKKQRVKRNEETSDDKAAECIAIHMLLDKTMMPWCPAYDEIPKKPVGGGLWTTLSY